MKYLVDLWEANISRLESQQSGKVWGEIATKINEQFNLARLPSQCERKIKHLKKITKRPRTGIDCRREEIMKPANILMSLTACSEVGMLLL